MKSVLPLMVLLALSAQAALWAEEEAVSLVTPNEAADAQSEAPLPDAVARIGDELITGAEFQRDLEFRLRRMQAGQRREITPDAAFRRETLQDLIDGRILKILARNAGIEVSDDDVMAELDKGRAALGTEEAFQAYLKQEGITLDFLIQELRNRLMTERWVEQKTSSILIPEDELRREYDKWVREGRLVRHKRTADMAHILIRVDGDSPEAEQSAQDRIAALRARIVAGEKFQDVAREASDDVLTAPLGGEYLEAAPGKMLPEVVERLFTLPIGEVSEPFRSHLGWHIMTVMAQNAPGVLSYERVRDMVYTHLFNMRKGEVLSKIIEDAKKVLHVEIFRAADALEDAPHHKELISP